MRTHLHLDDPALVTTSGYERLAIEAALLDARLARRGAGRRALRRRLRRQHA